MPRRGRLLALLPFLLASASSAPAGQGAESFLGIRYALPPTGNLRFAPAVLNHVTGGPDPSGAGSSYGSPCLQDPTANPSSNTSGVPIPSEDCLFLNIWRPTPRQSATAAADGDAALLPVLVYIHGGGFMGGTASSGWYNGSAMSASTGSLVVNFNYRLGPLGFLCLNAVSSSANSPASGAEQEGVKGEGEGEGEGEGLCRGGMNGLNDALTALKWIKNNIHVYGGDPSSVGLFGESSGGLAVCTLSLSPAASGLFSHSIVQSGPCNVPYPEGWGPGSAEYGLNLSRAVVQSVAGAAARAGAGAVAPVAGEEETFANVTLADLRAISNASLFVWPDWISWDPIFPGYFSGDPQLFPLPGSSPATVLAGAGEAGLPNPKSMLVGTTSKDGTAAFYGACPLANASGKVAFLKALGLAGFNRSEAEDVASMYPLADYGGSVSSAFIQADSDRYLHCPTYRLAQALARLPVAAKSGNGVSRDGHPDQKKMDVRVFSFDHFALNGCDAGVDLGVIDPEAPQSVHWASHGSDVAFTFRAVRGASMLEPDIERSCPMDGEEDVLSDVMMRLWSRQLTHGNPTDPALPGDNGWPLFSSAALPALVGSPFVRLEVSSLGGLQVQSLSAHKESICNFWEGLAQQRQSSRFTARKYR